MLTRMVNGVEEVISLAEEAQIRAQWAKNVADAPAKEASKKEAQKEQMLNSPEFDALLDVISSKLTPVLSKEALRTQIKAKMLL